MVYNKLEIENNSSKTIPSIIEQRNIRWLCHFTPRQNLENIKRNGLKTRDSLYNTKVIGTDNNRSDRFYNSICLSISKPNEKMIRYKESELRNLSLLLLDPAILYKKACVFYPHNAATISFKNMDFVELIGVSAFEKLFDKKVTFQKSKQLETTISRCNRLDKCETTSIQAEVQCLENIEPKYIKYIFEYDIPLTYNEIDLRVNKEKLNRLPTFEEVFGKFLNKKNTANKWEGENLKKEQGFYKNSMQQSVSSIVTKQVDAENQGKEYSKEKYNMESLAKLVLEEFKKIFELTPEKLKEIEEKTESFD